MASVHVVIALAVTGLVWSADVSTSFAQTPSPPAASTPKAASGDDISDVELTRAVIQVRRQALVTAAMELEPKEADAFWPLYREYRLEMGKVNDRFVKMLGGFLEAHATLTDAAAAKMMDDYLKIEGERTGVKVSYVPKFKSVMPARKVARFFQVDHKLDAIINADLAELVPLVR
jgi:hypothetical protein